MAGSVAATFFCLLVVSQAAPMKPKTAAAPHIFILLSDDLGYNNVGFRNSAVHTPHLDQLRADGIFFSRHYAYKFCSLLSGRLPVHVNERNKVSEAPLAGIPPGMTILPQKLALANYKSHHIGKWHCGMGSRSKNLPVRRGFNSSLGYLHGAEDHYTQRVAGNVKCDGAPFADLWLDNGPAAHLNGTNYSMFLFHQRAIEIINQHDPAQPIFLFLAYDNNHAPLQVPEEQFVKPYYKTFGKAKEWLTYQGMITAVDWSVGQIVEAVKRRGMYENSVLVWLSDNGGPEYLGGGGNNWPLRGGKTSNFEGGIRVPAVVSGGILPSQRRNSTYEGITMFADWYVTLGSMAQIESAAVDPAAETAGLPPVDGKDLSQIILGEHGHTIASPWAGEPILMSSYAADPVINPQPSSVLMMDNYKLITGTSRCGSWSGPTSPNLTHPFGACPTLKPNVDCGATGCLFDVVADPAETRDLASDPAHAATLQQMQAHLVRQNASVYNPDRGDPGQRPCEAARAAGGYWAPYLP